MKDHDPYDNDAYDDPYDDDSDRDAMRDASGEDVDDDAFLSHDLDDDAELRTDGGQAPSHDPFAPSGDAQGGQPSYVSVPCTQCGYNLTGIAVGGKCPECGAMVDASLYASGSAPVNGMAVTSMVLGIVSLVGLCCCGGVLGVLGLIFGGVALNQINDGNYSSASRGMAIAGLICSGVSIALSILWFGLSILGNL